MKQQQWQQQQSGGSVSPSGGGGVPATQQQQQHRSMYQPMGPHHQHLASMGFDPRWLMMQSYMDPRMMSGRPPIDMPTNIHPGRKLCGIEKECLSLRLIKLADKLVRQPFSNHYFLLQGGCLLNRLFAESLVTTLAPALTPLTT